MTMDLETLTNNILKIFVGTQNPSEGMGVPVDVHLTIPELEEDLQLSKIWLSETFVTLRLNA
jgi:hypothetical protein